MAITHETSAPVRPPTQITVARRVAAAQAVSLIGFAAVATNFAVRAGSAPEVTTGWGDFREAVVFFSVVVAIASGATALAVGLPACWLKRHRSMARIALIAAEYAAGSPVALALVSNLHARGQAPLLLLGTAYLGLTAAALIALHSPAAQAWTAER